MNKNYFGIIDIGSNTIRLVIYSEEKAGRLREVENIKSVARLRNHLDQQTRLTDTGIEKLVHTLQSFKEVLRTYTLKDLVCVATATIRQAKNQADILQLIHDQIGFEIRILSDQQEAFYGYLAVVNSTTITEGVTIDIGGGSTEITYFKNRQLVEAHSFSFGTITLKKFYRHEIPTEQETKELREFLYEQFDTLPWLKNKQVPFIAMGGSARNIIQIDQHFKDYPLAGLHQYEIQREEIEQVSNFLSKLTVQQRQKVDGLSNDRADIILPAIEVFNCLFQVIDATSFVLSRKGLRDGIFYQQLAQDSGSDLVFANVVEDSIQELVNDYSLNQTQLTHINFLTKKLFQLLKESVSNPFSVEDWILLKRASCVYNLGEYIDSESSTQHTFYLLANRTIDGLFHSDRLKLALVASYKSRSVFKQFIDPFTNWFSNDEIEKLQLLGSLLKFIYCLDTSKRQVVKDLELTTRADTMDIILYCDQDWLPEHYQAEKQKKHLEKALNKNIELTFVDTKKSKSSSFQRIR